MTRLLPLWQTGRLPELVPLLLPDPITMTLQYLCRLLVARLQWTGWRVIVNN